MRHSPRLLPIRTLSGFACASVLLVCEPSFGQAREAPEPVPLEREQELRDQRQFAEELLSNLDVVVRMEPDAMRELLLDDSLPPDVRARFFAAIVEDGSQAGLQKAVSAVVAAGESYLAESAAEDNDRALQIVRDHAPVVLAAWFTLKDADRRGEIDSGLLDRLVRIVAVSDWTSPEAVATTLPVLIDRRNSDLIQQTIESVLVNDRVQSSLRAIQLGEAAADDTVMSVAQDTIQRIRSDQFPRISQHTRFLLGAADPVGARQLEEVLREIAQVQAADETKHLALSSDAEFIRLSLQSLSLVNSPEALLRHSLAYVEDPYPSIQVWGLTRSVKSGVDRQLARDLLHALRDSARESIFRAHGNPLPDSRAAAAANVYLGQYMLPYQQAAEALELVNEDELVTEEFTRLNALAVCRQCQGPCLGH